MQQRVSTPFTQSTAAVDKHCGLELEETPSRNILNVNETADLMKQYMTPRRPSRYAALSTISRLTDLDINLTG